MKTLELRFKTIQENNPNYGAYIAFANAVKGQKFNKQTIHRWFYELVPKEDYDAEDKKDLFLHLEWLTKQPEDDKKWGGKRLCGSFKNERGSSYQNKK